VVETRRGRAGMTQSDALRLVALIDRLWFGAHLGDAMAKDPPMFAEWYEILRPVDAEAAREAVRQLNGDADRFPPRPGQIARRASDLSQSNIVALPDSERFRPATAGERAIAARRRPDLMAAIALLGARRSLRGVE